ncbi:GspH/FimT family pseudopilin [Uliginosibacterium sp. H1]|uniref:GspH/FimT family pseudopilin n=1 Tax=Uliginosibacterium sp. H1 TaxID=3114757 RepID=UPI002E19027F|nr:GspH/FimT family pseudopilin [Uliginosibacterium sp. H1]
MRTARGFSLIELMVTVTVLALLLAAALPNFREYLNNSRVRAVASEVHDGLQYARMEAIRRNESVTFCMAAATGTGWDVLTGTSCTGGTSLRSRPASASDASSVTLSPTSLTVTFSGTGRRAAAAAGTTLTTLDVGWSGTCGDDCVSMRVEVSAGGMIRNCSQNITSGPQACTASASASSSGGASSSSGGPT